MIFYCCIILNSNLKWNFFCAAPADSKQPHLFRGQRAHPVFHQVKFLKIWLMLCLFLKLFCFHNLFNFQTILNATGHTQYNHKCQGRHFKFILLMTFVHIRHICLTLGTNLFANTRLILLINFSGCSWKKASRSFYDSIHADHSDEHRWTFNHVLQAVFLWSSGSQQTIRNALVMMSLFQVSVNLTVMLVLTTMFVR